MTNTSLQCDFCSAPGPVWRYPARSFVAYCVPNVAGESVGDWAACDQCYVLIETDVSQLTAFRPALRGFSSPDVRVLAADLVTGPYDAIVLLEADGLERLVGCVADGLQAIPGVRRTTTCVAWPRT